jgi:hypothetical protein
VDSDRFGENLKKKIARKNSYGIFPEQQIKGMEVFEIFLASNLIISGNYLTFVVCFFLVFAIFVKYHQNGRNL